MTRQFILHNNDIKQRAIDAITNAPTGYVVKLQKPNRSLEQNAAQWPILEAFADQLEWPVNGQMCKLSAEEWKDVLTAAFNNETARIAMGLNGGVVMLGLRTSVMTKERFSEWLEFLHHIASDRGVNVQKAN